MVRIRAVMIIVGVLALLILAACSSEESDEQPAQTAGIANPASVHCVDSGFDLEIRTESGGGQYGVCQFPDGTECEEWAFFRGECKQGDMVRFQP